MNNNESSKKVMILDTEESLLQMPDRKKLLEILYLNLNQAKIVKLEEDIIFSYKGILYKLKVEEVCGKYYCLAKEI